MNSNTQNQIKPAQVSNEFMDQLHSIIDTKLQYIEFQIQAAFKPFPEEDHPDFPEPSLDPSLLGHIERYSKNKKYLLLIRSLVHRQNALDIYQLLHDNYFKKLNEEELNQFARRIE